MHQNRVVRIVGILLLVAGLLCVPAGILFGNQLANNGLGAGWGAGWRGWLVLPFVGVGLLAAILLTFWGGVLFLLANIETNLSTARVRGIAVGYPKRTPSGAGPEPTVVPEVATVAAPGAAVTAAGVAGAAIVAAAAVEHAEAAETEAEPANAAPVAVAAVAASDADPAAEAPVGEAADAAPVEAATATGVVAAATAADIPDDYRAPQVEINDYELEDEEPEAEEPPPAGEFQARLPGTDEAARVAAEMAALHGADADNSPDAQAPDGQAPAA